MNKREKPKEDYPSRSFDSPPLEAIRKPDSVSDSNLSGPSISLRLNAVLLPVLRTGSSKTQITNNKTISNYQNPKRLEFRSLEFV